VGFFIRAARRNQSYPAQYTEDVRVQGKDILATCEKECACDGLGAYAAKPRQIGARIINRKVMQNSEVKRAVLFPDLLQQSLYHLGLLIGETARANGGSDC
jgi:hypothetical protein